MTKAPLPNPALQPLAPLIGEWATTGTHPLLPDAILHGHSTFSWLEGGAFLVLHSEMNHKDIPAGTAIIGSDDATGEFFMLYFDERQVSRKYNVSYKEGILTWWRETPEFSQKQVWTFTDADTIVGRGQMSRDGGPWESDLNLTLERAR